MKIKLRDLSKEQFERWKNKNCLKTDCKTCIFQYINCDRALTCKCWLDNKGIFNDSFLNQEIEIEDEPLLTDEEKTYLENVIRPFKNRVWYVQKINCNCRTYLAICYQDDTVYLPLFEEDKYFKGLELYKNYTLENLKLFLEEEK